MILGKLIPKGASPSAWLRSKAVNKQSISNKQLISNKEVWVEEISRGLFWAYICKDQLNIFIMSSLFNVLHCNSLYANTSHNTAFISAYLFYSF